MRIFRGEHAEDLNGSLYRKALALEPNLVSARLNLGFLLEHDRRWEEAMFAYEAVLKEKPEDELALRGEVGQLLLRRVSRAE